MVKKDSDGKMETKPKFEPIDYEEELDFSLQTPTDKSAPNQESSSETKSNKVAKEKTEEDSKEIDTTPENKGEDAEHKVSVMVHRSQEKRIEEASNADPASQPHPKQIPIPEAVAPPSDKVDAPSKSPERKNSLVTVIKLGPESQPPQVPTERKRSTEEPKREDQTQQQVTFKIPASSSSKFPLLPPPPPSTSNKMRAGYTQILRPTPASPPMPVRNASAAAKSDKSKSLPRGLPSDFGDFEDEDTGEGAGGRAASLNPFQVDDAIVKEEAEKRRKQLEMRAAKGLFFVQTFSGAFIGVRLDGVT